MRLRSKRSPFICLLLASVATPALADNLAIGNVISTPVTTSRASNGSAGNVTINFGGGVSINAAGAAITLDSNNSIDSLGTIQNAFPGSIGIRVVGGVTGSVLTQGQVGSIVSVNGGGTGNIGLLLDGTSAFVGDITLGTGTQMFINGKDSSGVTIKAPLTGNLIMGAGATITGEGATGVLVLAPVSGFLATTLGINLSGTNVFTVDKIDPLAGSALAIGSNVGGGILNAGPTVDGDLTTASSLTSSGSAPTVAIRPSIAGANAKDITIGVLADTAAPAQSFINRGSIRATENDPGINTIALGIGENGAAANTVSLVGGIFNRGSILAQAESSNTFATTAASGSVTATAIHIGNGARINTGNESTYDLLNIGSITASVNGNMPSTSTGILVDQGGILRSLNNSGAIDVIINSADLNIANLDAYGVRDLSGTLTSLTNNGRITIQATILNNGAQKAIAVDLSRGTASQTFLNGGSVTGDILFGSATGNRLLIEGTNATVNGSVRAVGAGTIDVFLSSAGSGGAFRTTNSRLTSLSVGPKGTVEISLNKNSASTAAISATRIVDFAAGSKVTIVPSSFLPDSGAYTLIHADSALTFADFASATTQAIPFIFNGSLARDSNNLTLNLQRKTAKELGLTGNLAELYEPFAAAALTDNVFGADLLSLTSADTVKSVVAGMAPDIAGGMRALTVAMTDQATGVVAARQRGLVTAPRNTRNDFRFWGQEFYNIVSGNGSSSKPGYGGAGQGVALGVEWGNLARARYGLGYTFFSSQEVEKEPRNTKTNGDWNMLSFYGATRAGNFYVSPQINVGQGDFHSRRTIIGNQVGRLALADYTGYLASGGLSSGYIIDLGGFQIIPEISVDGLYMRQGAYAENGAGNMGLSLKQQTFQSVRGFAGLIGQGTYEWDNGNIQPQLLMGWSREFKNSPATIDGSFESAPGSPFHLVGPTLAPNKLVGGASVAYVLGNWSASLNYDATGNAGTVSESATISLTSRF